MQAWHTCAAQTSLGSRESPHPGSHALSQAALTIQLLHLQPHSPACSAHHGTQSIVSKSVSGNPQALLCSTARLTHNSHALVPPHLLGTGVPLEVTRGSVTQAPHPGCLQRAVLVRPQAPSQQLCNRPLWAASSAAGRSWEVELPSAEPGAVAVHGHKAPAAEAPWTQDSRSWLTWSGWPLATCQLWTLGPGWMLGPETRICKPFWLQV